MWKCSMFLRPIVLLAAIVSAAVAPASAQSATIAGIKAQLFYEETGEFSQDITDGKVTLWNTIIGEGGAGGPSSQTLVTVEVRRNGVDASDVKLDLRAAYGRKTLARQIYAVALYDEKTVFYAPLLLQNTGCREITLTARLTGKNADPAVKTAVIPFDCGE